MSNTELDVPGHQSKAKSGEAARSDQEYLQSKELLRLITDEERLTVRILKARELLQKYENRVMLTQQELAEILDRGVSTIRDAIKRNDLETGTSGWITIPSVVKWLGYNPILHLFDTVLELEPRLVSTRRTIAALRHKTDTSRENPSESVSDLTPAA